MNQKKTTFQMSNVAKKQWCVSASLKLTKPKRTNTENMGHTGMSIDAYQHVEEGTHKEHYMKIDL